MLFLLIDVDCFYLAVEVLEEVKVEFYLIDSVLFFFFGSDELTQNGL
jgi:hypothetical protein